MNRLFQKRLVVPQRYTWRKSHREDAIARGELNRVITSLCHSKALEFHRYGYQDITGEQIWDCVSSNYQQGWPRLHRLVNDILSLKANNFMNWLMLSVYREQETVPPSMMPIVPMQQGAEGLF